MRWPVTLLGLLLGQAMRLMAAIRSRRGVSEAIESSLSGVSLSHEDYEEACQGKAGAASGLHVCPRCASLLVQPTSWELTATRGRWRLGRRCPECEWESNGVFGESEIDAFDDALEIGAEILAAELEHLEREGVREIADVFSAALAADLITADDFRL